MSNRSGALGGIRNPEQEGFGAELTGMTVLPVRRSGVFWIRAAPVLCRDGKRGGSLFVRVFIACFTLQFLAPFTSLIFSGHHDRVPVRRGLARRMRLLGPEGVCGALGCLPCPSPSCTSCGWMLQRRLAALGSPLLHQAPVYPLLHQAPVTSKT